MVLVWPISLSGFVQFCVNHDTIYGEKLELCICTIQDYSLHLVDLFTRFTWSFVKENHSS